MKISLDWINDYVEIKDIDVEWLTSKFTITTAEIEEVHYINNDVIEKENIYNVKFLLLEQLRMLHVKRI